MKAGEGGLVCVKGLSKTEDADELMLLDIVTASTMGVHAYPTSGGAARGSRIASKDTTKITAADRERIPVAA